MEKDEAVTVVVHPSNADGEMALRFVGKCTEDKEGHWKNTRWPIVVTIEGNITEDNDVHDSKT